VTVPVYVFSVGDSALVLDRMLSDAVKVIVKLPKLTDLRRDLVMFRVIVTVLSLVSSDRDFDEVASVLEIVMDVESVMDTFPPVSVFIGNDRVTDREMETC
jgi:hypothetical protein